MKYLLLALLTIFISCQQELEKPEDKQPQLGLLVYGGDYTTERRADLLEVYSLETNDRIYTLRDPSRIYSLVDVYEEQGELVFVFYNRATEQREAKR